MYTIIFIYLSVNRHLGRFGTSALVNNAAVDMGVQMSLQDSDSASFGYTVRAKVGWLDRKVQCFWTVLDVRDSIVDHSGEYFGCVCFFYVFLMLLKEICAVGNLERC